MEEAKNLVLKKIKSWNLTKMVSVVPNYSSDNKNSFIVTFASPKQKKPIPDTVLRLIFTVEKTEQGFFVNLKKIYI
jgi:hypothetical protein